MLLKPMMHLFKLSSPSVASIMSARYMVDMSLVMAKPPLLPLLLSINPLLESLPRTCRKYEYGMPSFWCR